MFSKHPPPHVVPAAEIADRSMVVVVHVSAFSTALRTISAGSSLCVRPCVQFDGTDSVFFSGLGHRHTFFSMRDTLRRSVRNRAIS